MAYQDEVDIVSRLNGLGSLTSAQTNNLFGINHRGVGNPVPGNSDNYGLTFFTRPRLNLSYDNLAMHRMFTPLLSNDTLSIQRALRTLLDPDGGIDSSLVDPLNPFIPMLTNNLISITGWPDLLVDTYTSKEGLHKEAWSMVDGTARIFNTYTVTANFRNVAGDPISLLFALWVQYASLVYLGEMVPYPDMEVEREIDYQTRIYRLILDPTRQYVQKIGACGAAFPTNSPLGTSFNYASDSPFNTDNDQVSIAFQCIGADYLDPILVKEFNDVVTLFNPGMENVSRSKLYKKLNKDQAYFFNYSGYPYIDPLTFELQWWVPIEDFEFYFPGE